MCGQVWVVFFFFRSCSSVMSQFTIYVIVFLVIAVVLAGILIYMLMWSKKITNDLNLPNIAKNSETEPGRNEINVYTPRVYEAMYVRRDPTNQDVWLFSKTGSVGLGFANDVRKQRITHAMVYGRLYETTYVGENNDHYMIKMIDLCNAKQAVGFAECKVQSIASSAILHVLGYKFNS